MRLGSPHPHHARYYTTRTTLGTVVHYPCCAEYLEPPLLDGILAAAHPHAHPPYSCRAVAPRVSYSSRCSTAPDSAVAERTAAAVNDSISLKPTERQKGEWVCLFAPVRGLAAAARRGVRAYQPRVLPVEEADEVGRADAEHRPAVPIYSTGLPYLFIAALLIAPARRTYL